MITALLLILEPLGAWDRIIRAQRSLNHVLFLFLLPLLGMGALAEGSGLIYWGKPQKDLFQLKVFLLFDYLVYDFVNFLLWLGIFLYLSLIL